MIVAFHATLLTPHRFSAYLEAFKAFLVKRRAALLAAGQFHSSAKLFLAPFSDPRQRCEIGAAPCNRGAYARHSASASRATSARREAREVIS